MNESDESRIEKVESAIAHLQHDIDALNSSLLAQLKQIQTLDARFRRIEHELTQLSETPERRDPAAERPPHY